MAWNYIGIGGTGKFIGNLVASLVRLGLGNEAHCFEFGGGAVADLDWDPEGRDAVFQMLDVHGNNMFSKMEVTIDDYGKAKDKKAEGSLLAQLGKENPNFGDEKELKRKLEILLRLMFSDEELKTQVEEGAYGKACLGGALGTSWLQNNILEVAGRAEDVVLAFSTIGGTGAGMGPEALEMILKEKIRNEQPGYIDVVVFENYLNLGTKVDVSARVDHARSVIHSKLKALTTELKAKAIGVGVYYFNAHHPNQIDKNLEREFINSLLPLVAACRIVDGDLAQKTRADLKSHGKEGVFHGGVAIGKTKTHPPLQTQVRYTPIAKDKDPKHAPEDTFLSLNELWGYLKSTAEIAKEIPKKSFISANPLRGRLGKRLEALGEDGLLREVGNIKACHAFLINYLTKVGNFTGDGPAMSTSRYSALAEKGAHEFDWSREIFRGWFDSNPGDDKPRRMDTYLSDSRSAKVSERLLNQLETRTSPPDIGKLEEPTSSSWLSTQSAPFRMAIWFEAMVREKDNDFTTVRTELLKHACDGYFAELTELNAFGARVVLVENGPFVVGAIHPTFGPWYPIYRDVNGWKPFEAPEEGILGPKHEKLQGKYFQEYDSGFSSLLHSGSAPLWHNTYSSSDGTFSEDTCVPIARDPAKENVPSLFVRLASWQQRTASNGDSFGDAVSWFLESLRAFKNDTDFLFYLTDKLPISKTTKKHWLVVRPNADAKPRISVITPPSSQLCILPNTKGKEGFSILADHVSGTRLALSRGPNLSISVDIPQSSDQANSDRYNQAWNFWIEPLKLA